MERTRTMPTLRTPRPGAARALDRYRLEERLGAGAFGAVWLAYDETLERRVAVKVIPRPEHTQPDPRGRAQREALAAARLNHPGIVALYEAGEDAEAHYLVSELVDGLTLAQAIAQNALSDRDVVRIGVALSDALAHAHAGGVVHRDIKPGNVMIPAAPQSEAGLAKLTDFGVAHLAGEDLLTRTGDVVGTLAYMAPEQAEGRRVGPPADVYALALVLYEALAGFNPVRSGAPAATARRVAAGLPSLRRLRRDLPDSLVAAVDAALRRRPDERAPLEALRAGL
ncbi:MAG: serine/threonine protein kinase, partial [Actinomycetota bacterium]|nr:serine/threonine protein kinase [Actinomycetota bacterium]